MPNLSSLTPAATELSPLTVHQLRRRWKPHKERRGEMHENDATSVRLHRAFSWLQRVEELAAGKDLDLAILGQWIAFNAMYGQWDPVKRQTLPDRESWRQFVDKLLGLDSERRLSTLLQEHKRLVIAILEDTYLSNHFWQERTPERAGRSKRAKFDAATRYFEKRWAYILDRNLERVYLLRCQLMHGAATFGGKLNRTAIRQCSVILGHLLPAIVTVLIDHGADLDWRLMYYPPLS